MSEQMFIVENMFCSLAVACAIDFTLEYFICTILVLCFLFKVLCVSYPVTCL